MSPHHPFTGLQDPCLCHCLSTGAVWLLFVAISCPALLRCSSLGHLLCPNLVLGSALGRNGLSLLLLPAALCWLCKVRRKHGWIQGVNLICCSSSPLNVKTPL